MLDENVVLMLLSLLLLLLMGKLAGHILTVLKFNYLSESGATIIIGMVAGGADYLMNPDEDHTSPGGFDFFNFSVDMFFLLLLPPILFESGYSLIKRDFFGNFGATLCFAGLGTILNATIIGVTLYFVSDWMGTGFGSVSESLVFGSLISAVDPVATLAVFHSAGAHPLLYNLVFGEAMLNDAIAIVMFETFGHFQASWSSALEALWRFMYMSLGSTAVGVIVGFVSALFFKLVQFENPSVTDGVVYAFALLAYVLAESLGTSGIIAIFFCGIVMGHLTFYNISQISQLTTRTTFRTMANFAESFIFLNLGAIVLRNMRHVNWGFMAIAVVVVVLTRLIVVLPLSGILNLWRPKGKKITLRIAVMVWFAGLRGACSFALAQRQSLDPDFEGPVVQVTLGTVLFTTLVMGGLTEPLLKCLSLSGAHVNEDDHDEPEIKATPKAREERARSQSFTVTIRDDTMDPLYLPYGDEYHALRGDEEVHEEQPHMRRTNSSNILKKMFTRGGADKKPSIKLISQDKLEGELVHMAEEAAKRRREASGQGTSNVD